TVSVRLGEDDFLITPTGCDRWRLEPGDLVRIRAGSAEAGSSPSRSTRIHRAIYSRHPDIGSVILTQSPNAMAFAITGTAMDTRTIPESYLLLRDVPMLPFRSHYGEGREVAEAVSESRPVVLIANDCILVTGESLLQAYDRLEVAEFSARSIVDSTALGAVRPIGDREVADLRKAFGID
ncbi:MAG TPA: class II aldolase/adducin family protein, partial [Gammaproteobacteria bacterium]|nr:class II aldolase/adducin family protein [Gammaproteobacteria bacterium]